MKSVVLSSTGLYTPPYALSNDELVASFNAWVEQSNQQHAAEIAAFERKALEPSSSAFIEKASGIKSRYVMNKSGVIDPQRMVPELPERDDLTISLMCEIAMDAARKAMERAEKIPKDIDMVLCAASNMQRAYPAIAIEIQAALGINGFGFDMNVACSSATFAIQTAVSAIQSGQARSVLIVNPEITSAHLNWRDRDSHFIFGDACTAMIIEDAQLSTVPHPFEILATQLKTQFSNNIRNNFGFLNRCDEVDQSQANKLFYQQGRKVFKEVCPMAAEMIRETVARNGQNIGEIKRFWLHQANLNMNQLIIRLLMDRDALPNEAPVILDTYANTSSAGSIIAFDQYHQDLPAGALGVLCSFGAGYSIGCIVLRRK